jgi:hypothetical protein
MVCPLRHVLSHSFSLSLATLAIATAAPAAPAHADYLPLVRAYADAMIHNGRDTYGREHSPLFAAALDRQTMKLGTAKSFGAIEGVRESDRSLGGANPQVDTALYEILYALTEVTREPRYGQEADRALGFFFNHCQSPVTGLMAWGEHLYWDFETERCLGVDRSHEVGGEWPFWDRCYRLAPGACWKFAIGQWDHQIADQQTGDFSRHAQYSKHGPQKGSDFPRYAGQMILNWADAYARPDNARRERRAALIEAITVLLARMENNMRLTPTGYLPALAGADYLWPTSNLELARCLWKAAPLIEREQQPLAARMRSLALRQDEDFFRAPHEITRGGGFAVTLDTRTGQPRDRAMNRPYTATWASGYGYGAHAGVGLRCFERARQLEPTHPSLASHYRSLALAATDHYLTAEPNPAELQKPEVFATLIELFLAAHDLTRDRNYLDRADHFARLGVGFFLDDRGPLPKATNRHDHYETITGGPDFMYALLKLQRSLHRPAPSP